MKWPAKLREQLRQEQRGTKLSCLGMNPEGMVCAESGSGMVVGSTLLRVTLKSLNFLLRPMVNN